MLMIPFLQPLSREREGQAMEETVIESPYWGYERSAAYCNVNRSTIWRAVKAGQLRASGPGTAVRFHRDELDRWMDSRNRK
jgi:excisionase family DNA binding protein